MLAFQRYFGARNWERVKKDWNSCFYYISLDISVTDIAKGPDMKTDMSRPLSPFIKIGISVWLYQSPDPVPI
jgi:hypothetical protein